MCLVHFVVCLIYALPHRFSRSCSHAKSVATGVSQQFLVLPHVPFSTPILFNLRCKYFLGRFWQYGNKIKIELKLKCLLVSLLVSILHHCNSGRINERT